MTMTPIERLDAWHKDRGLTLYPTGLCDAVREINYDYLRLCAENKRLRQIILNAKEALGQGETAE